MSDPDSSGRIRREAYFGNGPFRGLVENAFNL